ncbi:MAG TPA: dicarboxylate/amino acid:cation symporter [Rhabdochlamydiaceae bacterium]|nr:dicarboxylate/amino acid:cation symporter [Rhabdochlamydiaceae bacterium]
MPKKKKSPWMVFAAIFLAMIVGKYTGTTAGIFGITFYSMYDFIGQLFLNALTLVVVPLVSSSIITGMAKIGSDNSFGRVGLKTFSFYIGTSLLAVLIGLLFVNLVHPGHADAHHQVLSNVSHLKDQITSQETHKISEILLQIIPSNVLRAFSQGQMLGLIFFSLIFGYAISKIESKPSQILLGFWQGIFQAMILITHGVMKFLPLGVFCLVAKVFATTGFDSLHSVGMFFVAVILGLLTFVFVALPLLLKFVGKVNPFLHFRAMAPALITAFSTSSSSATLPITMDCVEKRSGVSNRICSLVIPLGTSINMSGSALYECVAAMFVAQVYGIDLSFSTQFIVVLMALITSIGVAGIPSASLVAVLVILKSIGLPAEGIGLFIAVDRILDMCRTTVNVFSDSCCAVLVASSEGEKEILTNKEFST